MNLEDPRNWKQRLLVVCVLALGIVGLRLFASWVQRPSDIVSSVVGNQQPTVEEVVGRELAWADQQTAMGLGVQLTPVRDFFNQSRLRTRRFAEDALGWDSKWTLVTDFVGGKSEHARFLEERFAARLFTPEQLEQVVSDSVAAYLRQLDEIDAEFLVRLRADLEDVTPAQFSVDLDRDAMTASIGAAVGEAVNAVQFDFGGMVGQQVISLIAGDVLGGAAAQLATSAGILGVGAASGVVSCGITLVVGVIIDEILQLLYEAVFDPAGTLSEKVNGTLSQLESLILIGNETQSGLEGRLRDYANRRSQARQAAITTVIPSSLVTAGGPPAF